MQENDIKYDIKKILKVFTKIQDIMGDVIDYISVTPDEFAVFIKADISILQLSNIEDLSLIFQPNFVFLGDKKQLIIANTNMRELTSSEDDISYLMNFVNSCAEFICPCTGSEIHISCESIKIFIYQVNLTSDEFLGVYNLFDLKDLLFEIVLHDRPFIRVTTHDILGI